MRRALQRQIKLATISGYSEFCRQHPEHHPCWANTLMIFDWAAERRKEMSAEGRPHWVPSLSDFEQAARDCADDLVKIAALKVRETPTASLFDFKCGLNK